jgi:hypothetical protein|tara:strand:- start:172 stop:336 length:165 start_codon:yes stop_codon:yes gene_type:complete
MNTNPLDEIRERYKYGVEVYIDPERQVISTRPKQKPSDIDGGYVNDSDVTTSSD